MNKGSLADKSGATGQREQGEGGGGSVLFFLVKGHFTACCYHNNRLQRKGGGGVRHKVSLLPARHPALGLLWDNDYQSPDPGGREGVHSRNSSSTDDQITGCLFSF